MLIGITYDLKDDYLKQGFSAEEAAEFDSVETIEAIESSLGSLGYETVRIGNITHLVAFLAQGNRCDMVFNIAEGLHGMCREAQIPALLDAYCIPYVFSDSFVLAIALHKGVTKAVVREQGVPTPASTVVSCVQDIAGIKLPLPLFLKPVGGGTGMGINAYSIVRDEISLYQVATRLLADFAQPVLVEEVMEGREFTVGITGTGDKAAAVAVMEISVDSSCDQGIYSYKTKQEYLMFARYHLVDGEVASACCQVALHAWNALGCRDGGRVDLKMDSHGKVNFLEVNPLAGLNPVDSDLPILCRLAGVEYTQLIKMIMDSAVERVSLVRKQWIS